MVRNEDGAAAPNAAAFHPRMLTLAREARAMTQNSLANASGLSQGVISKIENGSTLPTKEAISAVARALGFPESFFFAALENPSLPLTFYRKQKTMAIGAVRRIEAMTQLRQMQLRTLLLSAETPEVRVPTIEDPDSQSPRQVALDLRALWHVPRGPIESVTSLLEDNGIIVVACDFGSIKISGLSLVDPKKKLPPIILVSHAIPGDRMRFTLSHELGHVLLHNHRVNMPEKDALEEEANDFASEFLMPASDIKGYFGRVTLDTLISMKSHWRVSISSLAMRAKQVGKITDRQLRYLYMQMSARGYRLDEPVHVEREEPTIVDDVIEMHKTELGYTDDELASALHLRLDEYRAIYGGDAAQHPGLRVVK